MSKEEIEIFNSNDFYSCVTVIEELWNDNYGSFEIEGKDGVTTLELTTGGWTENEEIINIISDTMFWFLWWQESKRGGYYKFVYKEVIEIDE